jgi:hypothetical protein
MFIFIPAGWSWALSLDDDILGVFGYGCFSSSVQFIGEMRYACTPRPSPVTARPGMITHLGGPPINIGGFGEHPAVESNYHGNAAT